MQKIQKPVYQTSPSEISAKNIVNNSIFYKSVKNPCSIDLVSTDSLLSF